MLATTAKAAKTTSLLITVKQPGLSYMTFRPLVQVFDGLVKPVKTPMHRETMPD